MAQDKFVQAKPRKDPQRAAVGDCSAARTDSDAPDAKVIHAQILSVGTIPRKGQALSLLTNFLLFISTDKYYNINVLILTR